MNLTLWIAAGLLAVVALVSGISKTFVPKEKLAKAPGGGWTEHASVGFVKTLGVLELLAAVSLILPAVLDIAPVMVPVTAACWDRLMPAGPGGSLQDVVASSACTVCRSSLPSNSVYVYGFGIRSFSGNSGVIASRNASSPIVERA